MYISYEILPFIMYLLIITLLVVLIVLVIRLIGVTDKLHAVLTDVEGKVKKMDGIFSIIDRTTDGIASFSDKIVDGLSAVAFKIFKKKYNKKEEEEKDE